MTESSPNMPAGTGHTYFFFFWPMWHAVSAPSHSSSFFYTLSPFSLWLDIIAPQLCVESNIQALSCWWLIQPGHYCMSSPNTNDSYPIPSDSMRTWVLRRSYFCINRQWQNNEPICMVKRVSLFLMGVNR